MNQEIELNETSLRLDWFTHQRYRLHRHLFSWLLFAFIFVLSYQSSAYAEPNATYLKIGMSLSLFLLAYLNMYWLLPSYLLKNKFKPYLLLTVCFILLSAIAVHHAQNLMGTSEQELSQLLFRPKPILYAAFALVFVAASTAIKLFQRWIEDTKRIHELTQTSLQAELEQLKNQINPHFLFNMLNNANVLTQRNPAKASQVLMALSDLLRYQLYDSAQPEVLLTSEIQFITDCLALEQIRRDNFEFVVAKEGTISGIFVPPFLFSTFVENAIEHSAGFGHPSFVEVSFQVSNHQLRFVCRNSVPTPSATLQSKVGGLGLANVKRRLTLLFGGKHTLSINHKQDTYQVELIIDL